MTSMGHMSGKFHYFEAISSNDLIGQWPDCRGCRSGCTRHCGLDPLPGCQAGAGFGTGPASSLCLWSTHCAPPRCLSLVLIFKITPWADVSIAVLRIRKRRFRKVT